MVSENTNLKIIVGVMGLILGILMIWLGIKTKNKIHTDSIIAYGKRSFPILSLFLALYLLATSFIITLDKCDVKTNKNASYFGIAFGFIFLFLSIKAIRDNEWVVVKKTNLSKEGTDKIYKPLLKQNP